jgi:hypothetical protein
MIFALALQYQSWSTARPEMEIRSRALAAQDRYNKIENRESAQGTVQLFISPFPYRERPSVTDPSSSRKDASSSWQIS